MRRHAPKRIFKVAMVAFCALATLVFLIPAQDAQAGLVGTCSITLGPFTTPWVTGVGTSCLAAQRNARRNVNFLVICAFGNLCNTSLQVGSCTLRSDGLYQVSVRLTYECGQGALILPVPMAAGGS